MTSPRWVDAMGRASDEAADMMRKERATIERLKAQIGLLLEGQSRYVTQVVLQHHLKRVDMVGVHLTENKTSHHFPANYPWRSAYGSRDDE